MPYNRASGRHFFFGLAFGFGDVRAMIRRLCAGLRLNIRLTALSASSPRDSGGSAGLDCGGLSSILALYHAAIVSGIIRLIGNDGSNYPSTLWRGSIPSPAVEPRRACPIAGEKSCPQERNGFSLSLSGRQYFLSGKSSNFWSSWRSPILRRKPPLAYRFGRNLRSITSGERLC
jgi:hypothetical protein